MPLKFNLLNQKNRSTKFQKMIVISLTIFISLIIFSGLNLFAQEKIPITTSSETAKEDFLKAKEFSEKVRRQEAKEYYGKAINEDPEFAIAYLYRSFTQTNSEEFYDDLNKAVSLSDSVSDGERLLILSVEAQYKADPAKQKEYLEKLIGMYPDDEEGHAAYAQYFYNQQEYEKAVDEYKKAVDLNPEYSSAYNMMGYAYRDMGKYREAEKTFKKYIQLIPNNPNAYDSYADLLLKMGNYDTSINYYKKALELDEDFIYSYTGLAANYIYQDNYDEARKVLQKLYDIADNEGKKRTALYGIAYSYINEGKMEEAVNTIEEIYNISEENKDYYYMYLSLWNIATLHLEMGKYDEARKEYKKSVEDLENSAMDESRKEYGRKGLLFSDAKIAMKTGNLTEAENKSNQFMEYAKNNEDPWSMHAAHLLEGMLALEKKNSDEALIHLKISDLENPYNLFLIAEAYKIKGNKKKAEEYYKKVINFNEKPYIHSSIARFKAKEALEKM